MTKLLKNSAAVLILLFMLLLNTVVSVHYIYNEYIQHRTARIEATLNMVTNHSIHVNNNKGYIIINRTVVDKYDLEDDIQLLSDNTDYYIEVLETQ